MTKQIRRMTSALLAVVMLVACVPAGMAVEDQTSGTVPVTITASAPTFSVTVPTTLPIHMDAYGGITCGDITITNNSSGPVLVDDTQITALNGWTLADYATTTFTDSNKGQHRVALQLSRRNGLTAAGADTGEDFIPAGGRQTISASAKIPYQGVDAVNTNIAQVTFVLGWHKVVIPMTGLNISGGETVLVGETLRLSATKTPPDTTSEDAIIWSSSNRNVATVNSTGVVTGVNAGTATITASCEGFTTTKTITVLAPPASVSGVKLFVNGSSCSSSWNLGPQDATNIGGNSYTTTFTIDSSSDYNHDHDHTLKAEIPPVDGWKVTRVWANLSGSTFRYIDFIGSNSSWQETLYYGMGWPLLSGQIVTVELNFTLTKSDDVYLRGLEILGNSSMIMEDTNQLTLKKLPDNTTDTSSAVWSSSNTDIATVNNSGVVTSKKAGTTTITATCGGQSATKEIRVLQVFQLEIIDGYTGEVKTTITPVKENGSYVANFKAEAYIKGGYAAWLQINPLYGPESNLDGYAWEMQITVPDGEVFSFSGNGRSEWPENGFYLDDYNSGEVDVSFRATPS